MADRLHIRSPAPRIDSGTVVDTGRVLAAGLDPTRDAIVRVEAGRGLVFSPLDGSASTTWPLFQDQAVEQVAVHPDGSVYLATVKGLYRVTGPDAFTARKIAGGALCLAIDAGGQLVVGTGRGAIWLGDDHPEFNGYAAHQSRVESVDRRGSIVLSGGADARVVWADVEADHAIAFTGHVAEVSAVCLGRDGKRGFSGSKDGAIKAWDSASQSLAWSVRLPGGGPVHDLVVWGTQLLATGRDRAVWALSLETGAVRGPWTGHSRPVGALIPVDEDTFWTWGRDRTLRRFTLPVPAHPPAFFGHSNGVRAVLVEDDHMWTASRDGSIRHWEIPAGAPAGPALQLSTMAAVQVLARQSDHTLYFGTTDGTVGIVDTRGRIQDRQKLHEGPVTCLGRLSADLLVSGGADGVLRAWDAHRLTPLAARTDHTDRVRCLAIVDDQLVTGSYDGTLALVSPLAGPVQARFAGHSRPVVGVVWTGTHIVSGSLDGTVRCWQLDGTLLHTVEADPAGIVGVVHTGGGRVVAVGKSGHATLWRTPELTREGHVLLPAPLDGLGCATNPRGTVWIGIGDQRGGITVLEVTEAS